MRPPRIAVERAFREADVHLPPDLARRAAEEIAAREAAAGVTDIASADPAAAERIRRAQAEALLAAAEDARTGVSRRAAEVADAHKPKSPEEMMAALESEVRKEEAAKFRHKTADEKRRIKAALELMAELGD